MTDMRIEPTRLVLGEPCKAISPNNIEELPFTKPHRYEYWEVIWCLDDEGFQSIDFVDYENKAGRFFTLAPGQIHQSSLDGCNVRRLVFAHGFVETNKRSTQLVHRVFSHQNAREPFLDCSSSVDDHLLQFFTLIQEECTRVRRRLGDGGVIYQLFLTLST